jgi:hypothetical protein
MITNSTTKINAHEFYNEYHGHKISHLKILLGCLKRLNSHRNYIYLAGDSSLDNKFWLSNELSLSAINDYQYILEPPLMKPDIAYHMNKLLDGNKYCIINTSIEESTIANRDNCLLNQDQFINENITSNDILIVSVGSNDVALSPTVNTMFHMSLMMYINSIDTIQKGPEAAWGMNYFVDMFKNKVKNYTMRLIGDTRPKKIIVCTIYYPDQKMTGSWADSTLGYLGYNTDPKKLQAAINQIFIHGTSNIKITGSQVIPFPMFQILDGKNTEDYVQRVEPSSQGGFKLAHGFVKCCLE